MFCLIRYLHFSGYVGDVIFVLYFSLAYRTVDVYVAVILAAGYDSYLSLCVRVCVRFEKG